MIPKKIFCVEADWNFQKAKNCSIKGVLDFLKSCDEIPGYVRIYCSSMHELKTALKRFAKMKQPAKPQILYIACHGSTGAIEFDGELLELEELGDILAGAFGSARKGVIVFGSCSTASAYQKRLKNFLEKTGAFAVVGYTNDVDFSYSTAFEMLLLRELQKNDFSMKGYCAVRRKVLTLKRAFRRADDASRSVNVRIRFNNDKECQ